MGRALAQRALDLASAQAVRHRPPGTGAIDLTRPAVPFTPPHVGAAAKAALDRGETHYTSRPGVPELRQAIARELTAEGFPATAETVVVANGGIEALYIVLQATLVPGDRVAAVEPVLPHVVEMLRFIGADVVPIATDPGNRFVPPIEAVNAVTAKVLLLQSPSPATGVAMPVETLVALVEKAGERGMTVVVDRSLITASYDAERVRFDRPDLGAGVFTVGSFSVGHGLVGWRVGYLSTPPDRIKPLRELKQALSICTTGISQYAALAAIEEPQEWVAERRAGFAARRDKAAAMIEEAGLAIVFPDAFPALLIDVRAIDADDRRFAVWLAGSAGVTVDPGSDYGAATAGFVRIDLGVDEKTLTTGLQRIAASVKERQLA
jgi:aspartate/methionine/tyrosine aminotransferase